MTQQLSKLKVIRSTTKPKTETKPLLNCSSCVKKQIGIQTSIQQRSLLACESTKTLYKQKYQQCEQRLGQQNQYLREYVIDLTTKLDEYQKNNTSITNENYKFQEQINSLQIQLHHQKQMLLDKERAQQTQIQTIKKQYLQRMNEYLQSINTMQSMIEMRQKCISQFKSKIDTHLEDIQRLTEQNYDLKNQLEQTIKQKHIPSLTERNYKPERRRARSTFNACQTREPSPRGKQYQAQLSPKQSARMDVLFEEFTELKSNIMKGQLDSSTAFRFVTLIQYLKQMLNKKNIQIVQLKQQKRIQCEEDTRLNQTIQKYQKALFQSRQQIQSLTCQISILKDQRNQFRDQQKLTQRNQSNSKDRSRSRQNSSSKKQSHKQSFSEFQRTINQQNNWRHQSSFSHTQQVPYRQIAKKQLRQKRDSTSSIFNDIKLNNPTNGSLSQRRNSNNIFMQGIDRYNYVYNKCYLSQYLKKRLPLIAYMTLVVKITQLVDKALKNGMYRVLTTKDIVVMTCQGNCPDSMRMKCELRLKDQQPQQQYIAPQGSQQCDQLSVMWSLGIIFNKIFDAIQPQDRQQQDLFKTIVSPQFQRILDSLLIQDPSQRMNINNFKCMLTKLS